MEAGTVPLAGEEESDEEEEDEEAAYGDMKVVRAGLEAAGAASGAAGLDLSRNGGCGG